MARYKSYNYAQMKMVAVSYERQILPGTFEHTLNHLIDHDIDLAPFAARYVNGETGAPAYDPAILLKVILYAYSRGVTSSRDIAGLCRENIIFMALSADSTPHFTTIAGFVAKLDREIVGVYREVLLVCDEMGLIGREMFAVDGVKMPSNARAERGQVLTSRFPGCSVTSWRARRGSNFPVRFTTSPPAATRGRPHSSSELPTMHTALFMSPCLDDH